MNQKKLLLHTCCAPCFTYVFDILKPNYDVLSYYFNPNIDPLPEYQKRLEVLKNYCSTVNASFLAGEYNYSQWLPNVFDYRFLGEKSQRCVKCIEFRLNASFEKAIQLNIDIVTTTLSVSPHKDADMINQIGKQLQEKYSIEFLESDFKKNGGYSKSIEYSKQFGLYRQNYCGCSYSKSERGA
jgi:predicted adenine nucleotide alpha hydrolase (AANH) superfamily ATPase